MSSSETKKTGAAVEKKTAAAIKSDYEDTISSLEAQVSSLEADLEQKKQEIEDINRSIIFLFRIASYRYDEMMKSVADESSDTTGEIASVGRELHIPENNIFRGIINVMDPLTIEAIKPHSVNKYMTSRIQKVQARFLEYYQDNDDMTEEVKRGFIVPTRATNAPGGAYRKSTVTELCYCLERMITTICKTAAKSTTPAEPAETVPENALLSFIVDALASEISRQKERDTRNLSIINTIERLVDKKGAAKPASTAAAVEKTVEPDAAATAPGKKRGRPPKVAVVTEDQE
jgi:hypothetical protein